GAKDFVEKPLDLTATLDTVRRVLSGSEDAVPEPGPETDIHSDSSSRPKIHPKVFLEQGLKGRAVPQRTLRSTALLYGQGLHTGKKSGLVLEPLPPDSGIHFVGVGESSAVPAHVDYVVSTGFATTLRGAETKVGTIEHLMSALAAFGITNLLVKCNGEVPV